MERIGIGGVLLVNLGTGALHPETKACMAKPSKNGQLGCTPALRNLGSFRKPGREDFFDHVLMMIILLLLLLLMMMMMMMMMILNLSSCS